jgi:hypothetical protein
MLSVLSSKGEIICFYETVKSPDAYYVGRGLGRGFATGLIALE